MKTKKFQKNYCVACALTALFISGCVSTPDTVSRNNIPDRLTLPETQVRRTEPAEGSLYTDQAMDIYKDSRAKRVGDILLVEIIETASGKESASTSAERASSIEGGISQFFGFEKWLSNKNANFTPSNKNLSVDLKNDFEGAGNPSRNSTVTATISARIIDITMEGNLIIQGYRETRVNNETHFLILSGIVRPRDISASNSIRSTHIADARIEYSGTGVISDKQQPGWLARGVDILWPF
jgi:flagellar L-ring protein FlgH